MKKFNFIVYGYPVAQQRHRYKSIKGKRWNYDPEKSKSWKETVRWSAIEAGAIIMDGAINLTLSFYLPKPKSMPKKVIYPLKKPDIDNLIKAVLDGLKGVCFRDDSQIVSLSVTKDYGVDKFGVVVKIEEES